MLLPLLCCLKCPVRLGSRLHGYGFSLISRIVFDAVTASFWKRCPKWSVFETTAVSSKAVGKKLTRQSRKADYLSGLSRALFSDNLSRNSCIHVNGVTVDGCSARIKPSESWKEGSPLVKMVEVYRSPMFAFAVTTLFCGLTSLFQLDENSGAASYYRGHDVFS